MGDRVVYLGLPVYHNRPGALLFPDTRRLFQRLTSRGRSVRIFKVDKFGAWIKCRFRRRNGTWEQHLLTVWDGDGNWRLVRPRIR